MVKKILMILLSIVPVYSTALPPTANGSVQSSVLSINKPIEFSSAGCFDNDVQDYGVTPYYAWDFDYDGTFNADYTTEEYLSLHSYSTCGHYRVALRYYDNDGQASELYILELDISIDSRFYYLKDHLGSVRVTIDEEGEIAGSDDYYPFGAQMPGRSVNIANPESYYKFSGKEFDEETGYSYFSVGPFGGARTYDGRIGRWLQVDPLADIYPGWSPYNYCVNNPLRFVDPDGRDVIVLSSSKGANGFSHGAVLVGSEINGWTYISKDGTDKKLTSNKVFGPSIHAKQIFEKGVTVTNIIDALNSSSDREGKPYDEAFRIQATEEIDKSMINQAVREATTDYNVIGSNCWDLVSSTLAKGGFDPGTELNINPKTNGKYKTVPLLPQKRFENIKKNNKGSEEKINR